ncbi:MAG: hypothetical protein ACRC1O_07305 [Ralstonia mannitolilytica]|uniref:hypothetical protein n=1 Tax=Ralstonia mannitolilytica TaxID=105219 RepID=UPI0005D95B09|nr:hypothetical protein [Ralstonia mannitolilytica]AJW43942.1 hypothetical protein TK49_03995 [Ralstonia mannitolilytica]
MRNKLLALIAAAPALPSIVYVLYRAAFVRVNHIGLTSHFLDIFSVVSVLLALTFRLERRWLWTVVLVAAANVLLVVWAIETNVLVEYEEWIRRGMPER